MVNAAVTTAREAARGLALGFAPARSRVGLVALFTLDARLDAVVRRASNPMVAQLKLTWWFEALERLDTAPPPAEPTLTALADEVLPAGVMGAALAAMVEGWERLIGEAPLDETGLTGFARERGGRLFGAAATVLGSEDGRLAPLGEGWALADLARRWSDAAVAARAAALASQRLDAGFARRWPARLRALSALGLIARADLSPDTAIGPKRIGRLLLHRLTGR